MFLLSEKAAMIEVCSYYRPMCRFSILQILRFETPLVEKYGNLP